MFDTQSTQAFPQTSHEGRVLSARGVWIDDVIEIHPMHSAHAAADLARFCALYSSNEPIAAFRSNAPALQTIFRVLMCGINRFNDSDTQDENSLISRDMQVVLGADQIQLNGSMPFLQAVAKFLRMKGELASINPNDTVLKALLKPSAPLGTGSLEVQLAAAFMLFLLTTNNSNSTSTFLDDLGLVPGIDYLGSFVATFFPLHQELENLIPPDLFTDQHVLALRDSIQRYFFTYKHTFFLTATGYLGNGPRSMEAGDRVVVFEGAKMPFIVRKKGEMWMLVGPCYVEGSSAGEPAARARRREADVVDVELC